MRMIIFGCMQGYEDEIDHFSRLKAFSPAESFPVIVVLYSAEVK